MSNRTWTDEQLIEAVKISFSYNQVLRNLHLVGVGSNYKTLYNYINKLNINISHFDLKKCQNPNKRKRKNKILNEELFANDGVHKGTHIRDRIISDNLITYKCQICEITDWQDKKLPLQIDHINGNNTDHRLENLRFLCPNCHAQTDTYCGKNKKNKLDHESDKICPTCNGKKSIQSKQCRKCSDKILGHGGDKIKHKSKIEWLPVKELIEFIKNAKSFLQAGKLLGVSDVAIRNHLIRRGVSPKSIFGK